MINQTNPNQWRLALQGSYAGISLALFNHNECIDTIDLQDKRASSFLITYIDALLKNHQLRLSDLSSIAVDKGPGAFTSLRTTIATINGIAFARGIPLIGIDGLDALAQEIHEHQDTQELSSSSQTMIILNAYSNDCYYLLYTIDHQGTLHTQDKGCSSINTILAQLQDSSPYTTTMFAGNATPLHHERIRSALGLYATFADELPLVASSQMIGTRAYHQQQDTVTQIIPNYMKMQKFAMSR